MVIKGGSRSGLAGYTGYLGWHLQRRDANEFIQVREMAGVLSSDLTAALDEMAAMGAGSRSKRPLYHANIDWKHDERLTREQKARAVDRLGDELGFAGQPRIVVEHVKQGREHLHVVWLRIDPETGKAIPDSHNFRRHEIVARDLEREFGLERVQGAHIERDGITRPERTPEAFEFAQAARSGMTPAEAKAELSALWRSADTGRAFAMALASAGWTLAQGDRRDVLVALDPMGETHAINKKITGLVAQDVRARLADLDGLVLPTVDKARQAIQGRRQRDPIPEIGGMDAPAPMPEATQRPSYKPENTAQDLPPDLDARFGPTPAADPTAGMVIDATPTPMQPYRLSLSINLGSENTPQHYQAKPRQVQQPEPQALRRQEPAQVPQPSASDNDARRAMEALAQTDPLGMAARHGFHAGDRLKTPEDMRREAAERARLFQVPQPEPTPGPGPRAQERGRLAEIVAVARHRLADLADRLDVAFARVRDQVLKPDAAARPTPGKGKGMADNGAVILEAMNQAEPPRTPRSMIDELRDAGRKHALEKGPQPQPTPKPDRSIWDDFHRRRMRGPGEGFEP